MSQKVNVGGSWKDVTTTHVNVGGKWKEATEGYVKVAGDWKKVWPDTDPIGHIIILNVDPATISSLPAGWKLLKKQDLGGGEWKVIADFVWNNHVKIPGMMTSALSGILGQLLRVEKIKDNQIADAYQAFGVYGSKLTSIPSDLDISNLTSLEMMFWNCFSFNQDISGWDTSKITNMDNMFLSARAFNQDLTSWDVSKVTDEDAASRKRVPATKKPYGFDIDAGAWTGAGKGPDRSGRPEGDRNWGRPLWGTKGIDPATGKRRP